MDSFQDMVSDLTSSKIIRTFIFSHRSSTGFPHPNRWVMRVGGPEQFKWYSNEAQLKSNTTSNAKGGRADPIVQLTGKITGPRTGGMRGFSVMDHRSYPRQPRHHGIRVTGSKRYPWTVFCGRRAGEHCASLVCSRTFMSC